jgi:pilus assembly protein FimV
MAALLDDIAEDNAPEAEPDAEEVIELDDLLDEADDLADLDALLAEADEAPGMGGDADLDALGEAMADAEITEVAEDSEDAEDEEDAVLLLDDTLADDILLEEAMTDDALADDQLADDFSAGADRGVSDPDDLMDAALAEAAHADLPVEESVPEDELDLLMDEPEGADGGEISDLTGLDSLDGDMEDMDSLLDNVEVDVSGVVSDAVSGPDDTGDEAVGGGIDFDDLPDADIPGPDDSDLDDSDLDDSDMDIMGSDMGDVLTAEAMPPDAGVDVSDDVDVDQLLADVRTESASVAAAVPGPASASVAELQDKVARLEARVAELETRIRQEIASLLPAEAARIIREEIAALAREMDD